MERILGQPAAVRTIQSAVDSGRVHHAWIFHGPFGVGKSTAAREFAKLILDREAQRDLAGSLRVDPESRTAALVDDDSHPDLHIIYKELALYSSVPEVRRRKMTNIPVDVLRERMIGGVTQDEKFHDAVAYETASLGHGKVFIIEEAELIDGVGQNALLKTLEQPPPGTVIILITTQAHRLLPTIRSRCQNVPFTTLAPDAMSRWFAQWEVDVSADERAWIETFAGGSPGLAVLVASDGLFEWGRAMLPMLGDLDAGRYPSGLATKMSGFVDEYADAWIKQYRDASVEMAKKSGARRVFLILGWVVRQRIAREAAEGGRATSGIRLADVLSDAEFAISRNVNLKMVFEDVVAQWASVVSGACEPALA